MALLVDSGSDGGWVTEPISGVELMAPTVLPYEVGNVLRRLERAGVIGADQIALVCHGFRQLPVELWPVDEIADRTWSLRSVLTFSDAAYVALAEVVDAPLITLDRRRAGAPGLRCQVRVPAAQR